MTIISVLKGRAAEEAETPSYGGGAGGDGQPYLYRGRRQRFKVASYPSFTIFLKPRKRKTEAVEIDEIELPEEIELDLAAITEIGRESLKAKLYNQLLQDVRSELESARLKQAEIDRAVLLLAWQRAKILQDYEDLILLMVASEDI